MHFIVPSIARAGGVACNQCRCAINSNSVMSCIRLLIIRSCCIDSKETLGCLTPYRSMASGMPLTEVTSIHAVARLRKLVTRTQ